MSCEWIKQEPLEENEIKLEAGPKQEIHVNDDKTHSVKLKDGESSYKKEEDYALESDSHLKVILVLEHSHIPISILF